MDTDSPLYREPAWQVAGHSKIGVSIKADFARQNQKKKKVVMCFENGLSVCEQFLLTNKQTNKMAVEQYTYWSFTLNNPTEADMIVIRNPNPKYVREFVWTPEKGAEGTEHIQAWLRLQRNQTLAFVKKLYPRAHLKPARKDEHNENTHRYAQKQDDTTNGLHHIALNDPIPGVDTILYEVIEKTWKERHSYATWDASPFDIPSKTFFAEMNTVESMMVRKRAGLEKLFVSASYEKMRDRFWREIILRLKHNQDAHDNAHPLGSSSSQELPQTGGNEDSQAPSGSEDGQGC